MPELPVEVHSTGGMLGKIILEDNPQPGQCIEMNGRLYRILERRHRYHFKKGKYHLHKAILSVQLLDHNDLQLWQGKWVIGNPDCKYNARSELLRCAINPSGSCGSCPHFEGL